MAVMHRAPSPWTGRSDPEDGPEALRIHHLCGPSGGRALIGFACEAGVIRNKGRKGASEGPLALRAALANMSAPPGAQGFADLGDVVVEGDALEEGQRLLGDTIAKALQTHDRVVVMGGGHETAFGSYLGLSAAYSEAKIGIINLDAHLDLRLVGENGPSSGTPFAQIRELAPDRFDYLCLGVAEEANTQALINRAKDWGVGMVSDHALIASSMAANNAIEAIAVRSDVIYLTIDIDLMPCFQTPGVSAPAPRGVPLEVVEQLVAQVFEACQKHNVSLPLADIVELSPPHDHNGTTARTAALLARRLLFS